MFPLRPPTNFKYRFFFSESMFISSFMPLMVDHVTRVAIVGGCDQPITCTSLGKSASTTFSVSTFGMLHVSNLGSVGVVVFNVPVIATSLEVPKKKKTWMWHLVGFQGQLSNQVSMGWVSGWSWW